MGSNKAVTLVGLLTLVLGIGGSYVAVLSYYIAYKTYTMERWKDCQDRPVRSAYGGLLKFIAHEASGYSR